MIIPYKGKIFCKILSGITKSSGGIYMARTLLETPHYAKVLAVGKPVLRTCKNCDITSCNSQLQHRNWKWYKHKKQCGKRNKLMYPCCEVGDIVHFKKSYRNKWQTEKGNFIFLQNSDIVAIER